MLRFQGGRRTSNPSLILWMLTLQSNRQVSMDTGKERRSASQRKRRVSSFLSALCKIVTGKEATLSSSHCSPRRNGNHVPCSHQPVFSFSQVFQSLVSVVSSQLQLHWVRCENQALSFQQRAPINFDAEEASSSAKAAFLHALATN